jgi:Ser/Thr protein kinase RdoA (MazF antagonist)
VSGHDLSADDVAARLEPVARRALADFGLPLDSALTLVNVSENATYAIDDPETGRRSALRLHRRGYHDEVAIESELAWLEAIRSDTGLRTPRVLSTRDGRQVLSVFEDGIAEPRYAVRFEWLPGAEPTPDGEGLPDWFERLGEITARLHRHARNWSVPKGFRRFSWDYEGAFGAVARWGRWQDGIAVGTAEREVLGRLDATLHRRLSAFGQGPDRYGLVHADLRLANLLVDRGETHVIDFDDCGQGWFLYDFGSAVSFFEHDPRLPELAERWVRGYRTVLPLPAADVAELATFVMMRRLLLVAWIGSHAGTDLARSMGAEYTETSCALAEDYLTRRG